MTEAKDLVPKLRFPEFLNSRAWKRMRLIDVCSKIAPVEAPVILSETDKKIMAALAPEPLGRSALAALGYTQPTGNYKVAMGKLLQTGLIAPTLPDKPKSRLQQYRLTEQGKALLK